MANDSAKPSDNTYPHCGARFKEYACMNLPGHKGLHGSSTSTGLVEWTTNADGTEGKVEVMTDEQRVKAVYPDAAIMHSATGEKSCWTTNDMRTCEPLNVEVIPARKQNIFFRAESEAWADAASRLPTPTDTSATPEQQNGTLLPCPFCGGNAEVERIGDRRQSHIIACEDCGAQLETGEDADWNRGKSWNRRVPATPEQQAPAPVAELPSKEHDVAELSDEAEYDWVTHGSAAKAYVERTDQLRAANATIAQLHARVAELEVQHGNV